MNRAWRKTLGYTKPEVAKLSIFEVVHRDYWEPWRERVQNSESNQESSPWEAIFLTKAGHHLYVEGNIGARFVCEKLVATRGIFHDVT